MKKGRHLPRRIFRTVLVYLLLNAGILGWIQVSAASGNKLQQTATVMAQVQTEADDTLRIAVLGHEIHMDLSLLQSEEVKILKYACTDPILLGIWSVWYR